MEPGRNEQRKALTRAKIVQAASRLFNEKGYAATSMEDISIEADVAIRTIYLHFESKAAVLLAYHDGWLDAFVALVGDRRPGEGVDVAVVRALAGMDQAEWNVDVTADDVSVLPAVPEFIGSGSPEIAGHILQRWVAALDALTARFRETSGASAESLQPRLDAVAVFATWLTTVLDFRERFAEGLPGVPAYDTGARAIRSFAEGLDATSAGTPAAPA